MTCASFSFDSDFVLGENMPQDKAYFIEGYDGTDYINSQLNPSGLPYYSDVTIYSCDLSDFEEVFEDISNTYGLVSEYYSNSPNNLLTLIGTLEYPNGTLTENCQSQSEAVTWTINNKLVDTITINNKEVQSIKIGAKLIYEKVSESSNILFEDDCSSSSGLSNYRTPINIDYPSIYGSPQLTYDSTNDCYAFTNSLAYDYLIYQIPELDGKTNFTFSCECKIDNNNSVYVGLGVMPSESNLSTTYAEVMYAYYRSSTKVYNYVRRMRRENTFTNITTGSSNQSPNQWFKLEMVMDNSNNVTFNFKTLSGTTFKTVSSTISADANDRHYGLMFFGRNASYKVYVRNIIAEKN